MTGEEKLERGEKKRRERTLAIVKNLAAADDSILDVGCGYGWMLKELESAGYKKLYGCDMKRYGLLSRRLVKSKITFKKSCLPKLPFAGRFKAILLCEVLEHLLPCESVVLGTLASVYSYLDTNGSLVVTTPDVSRWKNRVKLLLGKNIYNPVTIYTKEKTRMGRTPHLHEFTKKEILELLRKFRWKSIKISSRHGTLYAVCRK
jgi:2-polyprenyl-3-methyl-5-hydroxy-6-metoxy-1,4-benzoquinol methylase